MPEAFTSAGRRRGRAALAGALAALALAACGGEDEPAEGTPAADRRATETVEPPLETAPEGTAAGARGARDKAGSEVVAETETEPRACPDVVITPDSGNGLFEVEAEGITCEDAGAALEAWGRSGYPGEGPQGFACRQPEATGEAGRLRCEQEASGAVVEFETGN